MSVQDFIVQITSQAVMLVILVSLPMMLISLFVGLLIAVFSATTQIQEQTLSFVPKMIAVFLMMAALGGWIGNTMVSFAHRSLQGIAEVVR